MDSQNVLDVIKKQGKTVFDRSTPDGRPRSYDDENFNVGGKESAYAALVDQRNLDELENTCTRNRKYLNADDNMVLDPSQKWSVPRSALPFVLTERTPTNP